jgi:hypothetical protein
MSASGKRCMVWYTDPEISDTGPPRVLSAQKRDLTDAVSALKSEKEPESATVLHLCDFGVCVVELTAGGVDKATRGSRVVEVVEDERFDPHSDCGRGGETGEGWSAGNSGAGNWNDADPCAAGCSQALYDSYGHAREPYEVGGRHTPYLPGPFPPEPLPPGSFPPGPVRAYSPSSTSPKPQPCPEGPRRMASAFLQDRRRRGLPWLAVGLRPDLPARRCVAGVVSSCALAAGGLYLPAASYFIDLRGVRCGEGRSSRSIFQTNCNGAVRCRRAPACAMTSSK